MSSNIILTPQSISLAPNPPSGEILMGFDSDHILKQKDEFGNIMPISGTATAGPTGPQGFIGLTGPQGFIGPTGFQGWQGFQGRQGPIGFQGTNGVDGATGSGATGPQGLSGFQGPQGFPGDPGGNGATGSDGIQGPTGPQGFQGFAGSTGSNGIQGPTGPQGLQGLIGTTGPQGFQGPQGWQGFQGFYGPTGFQGPQGQQGPQGPSVSLSPYTLFGNPTGATSFAIGITAGQSIDFSNGTINVQKESDNSLAPHNSPGYSSQIFYDFTSAHFSATNKQLLYVPSNPRIQGGNWSITISAWVKFDSVTLNPMVIISKDDDATKQGSEYFLGYYGPFGTFIFQVEENGHLLPNDGTTWSVLSSFGTPVVNQWYFVVGWYDHTAKTVNIQINNGTVDTATGPTVSNTTNTPLTIGCDGNANFDSSNSFFDGSIKSASLFKRVLSTQERASLYNGGLEIGTFIGNWEADVPSVLSSYIYSTDFNGSTSSGVVLGSPVVTGGTISGAISFWFNSDDLSSERVLISNTTNPNTYVAVLNSTTIRVQTDTAATFLDFTVATMSAGIWYNVLVNFDGTYSYVYVDGTQSTTGHATQSHHLTIDQLGTYWDRSTTSLNFIGDLSDVRLFSGSYLTASDIVAIHAGLTTSVLPVAWYKLNEGSGTLVTSGSGPLEYNQLPISFLNESEATFVSYWDLNEKSGTRRDRTSKGFQNPMTQRGDLIFAGSNGIPQALSASANGGFLSLQNGIPAWTAPNFFSQNFFSQGGNTFGATAILGTLDNNNISIIGNGTQLLSIFTNSNINIGAVGNATSSLTTISGSLALNGASFSLDSGNIQLVQSSGNRFLNFAAGATIQISNSTSNFLSIVPGTVILGSSNQISFQPGGSTIPVIQMTASIPLPMQTTLSFKTLRNDGQKYAFINTADFNIGTISNVGQPLELYIYSGKEIFNNNQGNLYLGFDGVGQRGNILIGGTVNNGYKLQVFGSASLSGDLLFSGGSISGQKLFVISSTTSPINLTTSDYGKVQNNAGATISITYNLPAATDIGAYFQFSAVTSPTASKINIRANGTDIISTSSGSSSPGGTASSTIKSDSLTLYCYATGNWISMYEETGNWLMT